MPSTEIEQLQEILDQHFKLIQKGVYIIGMLQARVEALEKRQDPMEAQKKATPRTGPEVA